jgi:hypothetical protein
LAIEKFTKDIKNWNSDLKAHYLKAQPLRKAIGPKYIISIKDLAIIPEVNERFSPSDRE